MSNEIKKPIAIGDSFMYLDRMDNYILGLKEEKEKFVVSNGKDEKEFNSIFAAVEEILINCGYQICVNSEVK
jgi:hypothetical protein